MYDDCCKGFIYNGYNDLKRVSMIKMLVHIKPPLKFFPDHCAPYNKCV